MKTELEVAIEALEKVKEVIDKTISELSIGKSDFVWECNSCGSQELTSSISENELEYFACSGCGENEFHKVYI